jgi:putative transposase
MRVARSGYYAWRLKPNQIAGQNAIMIEKQIRAIFKLSRNTYGVRRIKKALREEGIVCNHKKVRNLMRKLNLIPKVKRKFKATTNSKHSFPIEPNKLERQFCVAKPNLAWVGDITYISTDEGWLYLAVVIYLF